MANTDFNKFLQELLNILQYNDNTGSVNLYMAHGGTNFGWTAGAKPLPIPSYSPCPEVSFLTSCYFRYCKGAAQSLQPRKMMIFESFMYVQ